MSLYLFLYKYNKSKLINPIKQFSFYNIMDTKKVIKIEGTSNRYQMKKCMKEVKEIKPRKSVAHISSEKMELDSQLSLLHDHLFKQIDKNIVSQVMSKLGSYKQQDIEKKIYDPEHIVILKDVFELLESCKLSCYYCSQELYLLYSNVREKKQWTLDRIDNSKGHNKDNVLIACLECNLKRRNQNKTAFLFTKNMVIIRDEFVDDAEDLEQNNIDNSNVELV